jgi:thiol-disulfide isomerase/thioredoxin
MKLIFALSLVFAVAVAALAQNEQAPLLEKEISYKDWTYKNPRTGSDVNLRQLTTGKKLTIVVYYAPWCLSWALDAPMLERFYQKYKGNGLEIVGVGEYDPVESMKANLEALKVTFPTVYESESRDAKQKSLHYEYRKSTGDTRGWGSPYYVFLTPEVMEKKGDLLTKKTFVVNGELIDKEGDAFIRKALGLPAAETAGTSASRPIEVCDPAAAPTTAFKKP